MRGALPLAALLAAAPAQQVIARPTPVRGAIEAGRHGLVLPAGEFTVAELIDATAAFLCRNYLYDHDAVAAARGFTLQRALDADALGSEELLYALLSSRGFAVLPLDEVRGVYQIVDIDADRVRDSVAAATATTPRRSAEEILRRPRLREIVMTAIHLARHDSHSLASTLRMAFSQPGPWQPGMLLASSVDRRILVLHGYREQVAMAIQLARHCDREAEAPPTDPLVARVQALEQEVAELRRLLGVRAAVPGAAGTADAPAGHGR